MDFIADEKGNMRASASGEEAIQAQARVLHAYIQGRLLMRLGLYGLAALFVVTAALLVAFAPEGREITTGIIAVALLTLAAGSAGFGAFAIKTPLVSGEANSSSAGSGSDWSGRGAQPASLPEQKTWSE